MFSDDSDELLYSPMAMEPPRMIQDWAIAYESLYIVTASLSIIIV